MSLQALQKKGKGAGFHHHLSEQVQGRFLGAVPLVCYSLDSPHVVWNEASLLDTRDVLTTATRSS